jgi:excinuclease ABC subunit C
MAGEALRAKLEGLPDAPGVYIFLGEGGEVLYVGKASSLRNRVRSYFQPSGASPKAREIVREAVDLDYIVTRNEAEALILEDALIKKHRPRFNTRLRDDKRYPYVKLTAERFPRLVFVRRPGNDGARYFGPFTSAKSLRRLLSIAQKIFPLRTCNLDLDKGKTYRPCLYYHLGKCPGPCTGEVSPEEYHRNVEGVAAILSGKTDELVAHLHQRMEAAAKEERFEEAAKLRDYLRALERLREKQAVALPEPVDLDAVGIATADGRGYGLVLLVRGGRLIGREGFPLVVPEGCSPTEALGEFLDQYYTRTTSIPQEVLLPFSVPEADALARYLAARREQRVEVKAPARGPRRELVAMAQRNAALSLKRAAAEEVSLPRDEAALEELAEALDLPTRPWRIEAFDISNIHGKEATGSMVAFVGGRPRRDAYRRFRVRIAGKPDDYAMMEEVLRRRFSHGLRELQEARPGGKFSEFPDLVLVDGGKGQLNVALRVLEELGLSGIEVAALAKREEEIYRPGRKEPIRLSRDSEALKLLQRIRDEAHRFAVEYHRLLRRRETLASLLDSVPGIGPVRRRMLLERFGSLEELKRASLEDLLSIPGFPKSLALKLYKALHEKG